MKTNNLVTDGRNSDYSALSGVRSNTILYFGAIVTLAQFLPGLQGFQSISPDSNALVQAPVPVEQTTPLNGITTKETTTEPPTTTTTIITTTTAKPKNTTVLCTCGVFLSGQFKKGNHEQPTGAPVLRHEQTKMFPCNPLGVRQCQNKCLETFLKHLPNAGSILCATMNRDCHKEKAFLFMQNCTPLWVNSNLSSGKEYCCKDGLPYQCPLI